MDTLRNKAFAKYDYKSRYITVPYYYDTLCDREVYGIGNNLKKDTAWAAHKVKPEDTLDSLALKYYNNPTYWWVIAYFNDIQDAFVRIQDTFDILKIPSITNIEFGELR